VHIDDFDALIDIVEKVKEVLTDLALYPNRVFPPDLWEPFRAAMVDLGIITDSYTPEAGEPIPYPQVKRTLDELQRLRELKRLDPSLINATQEELLRFEAFSDHGLCGPQLKFKKSVIDAAYADYVAHGRVSDIPKNDARWVRRAGRYVARCLGPATTVLDSLAIVIPPVGAISEAAGVAQHAIERHHDRKKR
jgi:hypothetical protein